jgi:hypothetical protein
LLPQRPPSRGGTNLFCAPLKGGWLRSSLGGHPTPRRPLPNACEAVVHEVGGPIPLSIRLAIPLQTSNLAKLERDKLNPAERSDHSPDPSASQLFKSGGGGWGVGESNVGEDPKPRLHSAKKPEPTPPPPHPHRRPAPRPEWSAQILRRWWAACWPSGYRRASAQSDG